MKLWLAAITLPMLIAGKDTSAAEAWACTFPGYTDGKPAITKFHIDGDDLIEEGNLVPYKILQNSDDGLVAVDSAAAAPVPGFPEDHEVYAFVVVIEKKTHLFIKSSVSVWALRNHSASGRCIDD